MPIFSYCFFDRLEILLLAIEYQGMHSSSEGKFFVPEQRSKPIRCEETQPSSLLDKNVDADSIPGLEQPN
jgi:hypothetical protein